MRTFAHDPTNSQPGTWARVLRDERLTARIRCHDCPKLGTLDPTSHTINERGEVSPSVVCECGYHEVIELRGWPLAGQEPSAAPP